MDIPENVVTLILVRLPVKSLLKFRCVCKAWRSLIGSSRFEDMHLRHPSQGRRNEYLVLRCWESDQNAVLSCCCWDGDLLNAAAPDWRPAMNMVSIGRPINGICLVGTFDGWDRAGNYWSPQDSLYLCNPATHELRKIPDRPFGKQRARPTNFSLEGPPFDCKRVSAGLGYDSRTNDYKVVSIMHFLENHYYSGTPPYGPLKIEMYDLSYNSWRVADTVFPTINLHPDPIFGPPLYPADLNTDDDGEGGGGGMFGDFTCDLFFNGSIHWHTIGYITTILAFNISNDVMLAFNLPRGISSYQNTSRSFVVLDNSLAFVQRVMHGVENYSPSTPFYIWVIAEYGDGESWIKRFYFQPEIHMDVLTFWNNILIFEAEDGELVSCNLREDAAHQFRKHHHITRIVHELSNHQRVQQGLVWNMMGAIVMHKKSLLHLRLE